LHNIRDARLRSWTVKEVSGLHKNKGVALVWRKSTGLSGIREKKEQKIFEQ
jgi:hypothetical protein